MWRSTLPIRRAYECCPEHHVRVLGGLRTNGGQLYGRATAYGGDAVTGYRISYGDRKGSDYVSGNDTQIPSSYDTNDVFAQWGYSFNPDQRLELSYLRYEQVDTEYPGEFFNIDDLETDGFNVRLADVGPEGPWSELRLDAWWNRTRFNGDNFGKHIPNFPEVARAEFAFERFNVLDPGSTRIARATAGDLESTGARAMATFGEREADHLNLGTDIRYIEQNITENISINSTLGGFPFNQLLFTNLPRSWAVDPGLFAEYVMPMSSFWTAKMGGRVDFYNTRARFDELRPRRPARGARKRPGRFGPGRHLVFVLFDKRSAARLQLDVDRRFRPRPAGADTDRAVCRWAFPGHRTKRFYSRDRRAGLGSRTGLASGRGTSSTTTAAGVPAPPFIMPGYSTT